MKTLRTELRPRQQRGYSLAEVMVAMAIFTVLVLAALTIYDRSNRVFNQGMQASDMQQSTRVAFDKLVSDIRLAGFDYDRDGIPFGSLAPTWSASTSYVMGNLVQPNPANGHTYLCVDGGASGASQPTWPTDSGDTVDDNTVKWQEKGLVQYQQPDEQIEYAGDAAVTIRANFDYETETGPCATAGAPVPCENGREEELESTQFPLVTTDNDEIVTYALVSNSSNTNANKDKVEFYADIARPREVNPSTKAVEPKVTIDGVDTTNLYPPYTLYRYTLDNDGNPVPTPIADNIRSLNFHYYTDNAGTLEITPLPDGEGPYDGGDIDTAVPERDTRASIKSIRVELVGMNPNLDAAYTDADAAASHYRKYPLTTLVVPRNIGKHGMKEFSTTAPSAPEIQAVCTGACNAVYVTWKGPISGGDVDSYNLLYDEGTCGGAMSCAGCNVSYAIAEDVGANLSGYATKVTPGKTYRFAVQSINKYGSATSTNCIAVNVLNTTKPATPSGLDASGGLSGTYAGIPTGIQLYWPPVTKNNVANNTTTCSDGTSKVEDDLAFGQNVRYRIYRSANSSFKLGDAGVTQVLNETTSPQPTLSGSNMTWTDSTPPMGSCVDYYYRVVAATYPCCTDNAMNSGGSKALAVSGVFPDDTTSDAIKGRIVTASTPAAPTGVGAINCGVNCAKLSWTPVTKDTAGAATLVDTYTINIYEDATGSGYPATPTWTQGTTSGLTELEIPLNPTHFYKFTVQAVSCNTSAESAPAYWPCDWNGGAWSINVPSAWSGSGTGASPWVVEPPSTLSVTTTSNIDKVVLTVTNTATGAQIGATATDAGPKSAFSFALPDLGDSGVPAQLHVSLYALAPSTCVQSFDYYIIDQPPPACALTDVATDATVMSLNAAGDYVDITLKNTSGDILVPQKMWITWNNANNGPAKFANGISSVSFDKNGASPKEGLSATCNSANVVANVTSASPDNIAANQNNYVVRVTFAMQAGKSGSITTNPITNVCVQYRTPLGDVKTCSVAPNAGACVMPASNCF